MQLVESGKGGLARVVEILDAQFQSSIAVVLFRVTAVDDRGNNVSLRTKLVHVVYVGKGTPVLKRAKVTTFNAAFKQPFTQQLALQTDDVADLNEESIEKALNASTGAHKPTSYDFTNNTQAGPAKRNDMVAIRAAQLAEKAEEAALVAAQQQEEEQQQVYEEEEQQQAYEEEQQPAQDDEQVYEEEQQPAQEEEQQSVQEEEQQQQEEEQQTYEEEQPQTYEEEQPQAEEVVAQ
ncbi:hypothetical protein BASA81_000220 [Batrachochytrium salamandrivorans]|nr:hypothetical protein BASA81_000220 [Batrachochytrium salamandrivorans]